VSKEEFSAAVAAEGAPFSPGYPALAYANPYIMDRQTYGQSGCPWCCPFWGGEISYEHCCPNAELGTDIDMRGDVHESFGEQEAADVARAIIKVDEAYRL